VSGGEEPAGQKPFAFTEYEESLNTSLALSPSMLVYSIPENITGHYQA
jgi:hypothetical protein